MDTLMDDEDQQALMDELADDAETDGEGGEEPEPEGPPLELHVRKGESQDRAVARFYSTPEFLAGMSLHQLTQIKCEPSDINQLIAELEHQTELFKNGDGDRAESILSAQSHTLDAMFHNLIRRADANISAGYSDTGREYLKLALKAQSQCRSTVDSLCGLKRPVIRQTNIAHGHQQVNNIENPPNELLEKTNGEWLDFGKAQEAVRVDSDLATVEE
jgi:hypothetical protein